jgi:fumarate hydratase, class I
MLTGRDAAHKRMAERGQTTIDSIKRRGAAHLVAVGGAGCLVSKAVRQARVLAVEDLGVEAIREFPVEGMPVTVAVDAAGTSIHRTGPSQWRRLVVSAAGAPTA